MIRNHVLRRAIVTATAALTTIALAAPGAGAADVRITDWAGLGSGQALNLKVTTPAQLAAVVNTVTGSSTIEQTISKTSAELASTGSTLASTTLLEGLLNEGSATSTDAPSGKSQFLGFNEGGIDIGVGTIEWDTTATSSHSFSELAHVRVGVADLARANVLPVDAEQLLDDALADVTATVDGLVTELNGVITEVETTLNETTGQDIDLPTVSTDELPALPDLTSVDLVDIKKIWSQTDVTFTGDLVRSESVSGIVNASLLGGTIEIPAFTYSAWAETAGTPGTAKAGTDVQHIEILVGDSLVSLVNGTLGVGDVVVDLTDPVLSGLDLDSQINEITDILASLLNTVGVDIREGEGTTEVAADGSSASATVSAFLISVTPLNAIGVTDLGVNLELMPTAAAVTAAAASAPAPAPEAPQLPRTGGGAAAMLLGSLALGSAAFLRRKF